MKTIPVLINHDQSKPIGTMTIDETKLPPGIDYVFSLGSMIEEADFVHGLPRIKKAELIEVSLQTDKQYLAYLKHESDSRLAAWLNNNMTFYNTDEQPAPTLSSVSKRIWYHATDDTETYPFGQLAAKEVDK